MSKTFDELIKSWPFKMLRGSYEIKYLPSEWSWVGYKSTTTQYHQTKQMGVKKTTKKSCFEAAWINHTPESWNLMMGSSSISCKFCFYPIFYISEAQSRNVVWVSVKCVIGNILWRVGSDTVWHMNCKKE